MTIGQDTPVAPVCNLSFSLTHTTPDSQEYPYGKEALYRDCIAQVMRADGWVVKIEVRTEFGIADLVARRGVETWVIEAKLSSDNNSIAHACGQLLFYTVDLPFTKRMVATPECIRVFKLHIALKTNSIDLFEYTEYHCKANSLFKKELELKKSNDLIDETMEKIMKSKKYNSPLLRLLASAKEIAPERPIFTYKRNEWD